MNVAAALSREVNEIDFGQFPRMDLCHRPTPVEPMVRLGEALAGPRLYVKRDDCTGLASGGNKTRKLEFLVGEALAQGADILVTQGAVQSNHVRQTAAAACRAGLKCHALLERRVPCMPDGYETTGNVLMDRLFGATLEFRPAGLDMNAEATAVAEKLKDEGCKPYFIPGGGRIRSERLDMLPARRRSSRIANPGERPLTGSWWRRAAPERRQALWRDCMRWGMNYR